MIGLVQTADGAIEEQISIAQRIRVLSVQSANDTQDTSSRGHIQTEVNQLTEQFNKITSDTKFNDKQLLGSTGNTFVAQYGYDNGMTFNVGGVSVTTLVTSTVSSQTGAATAIDAMDTLITALDTSRATLGSQQNRLESNIRNISTTQVNVAAAESQIRDVDFAAESATFAKHNILAQSGSYAMSQANAVQQNVLRLLQ